MTKISYDAQGREIQAPVRVEEAQKRAGCASKGVKNAQVRENDAQLRAAKVINTSRARGLDVDGLYISNSSPLRPRVRAKEPLLCTWREAVKATDYALEHFGDRERDRGRCLAEARRKLAENGLSRLLPVLDQIVRNGKNRQESIGCLAKVWHVQKETARRRYYRGTEMLLTFFSPNEIKG